MSATVHVCATPYRPIERDSTCSVRALCDLLARYAGAIRVYVYAVEGSYVPPSVVDEVVTCVRRSTVRRASRPPHAEAYAEFVSNAHREIVRRRTATTVRGGGGPPNIVFVVVEDEENGGSSSLCARRLSENTSTFVVIEMFRGRFGFSFRRVSSSTEWSQTLELPFPAPSTSPSVVGARRPKPRRAIVCGGDGDDLREGIEAVRLAGYVPHVIDGVRHIRQRREEIRDAAVVVVISSTDTHRRSTSFSVPYESMSLGTPVVLFGPHHHPCVKALLTFEGYPAACARGEIARDARVRALRDVVEGDEPAFRAACRRRALSVCSANVVAARLVPWMITTTTTTNSAPPPHRLVVGRVYCVNLRTRRPDRYARMRRVFAHEGFDPDTDVTFVDANDVVDNDPTPCPWTDAETFGNARNKHATFLSHLRTWRHALADWNTHDASHALICEDDLVFAKDWRARIDDLLRDAPQTKLVMLNACARNQDRWIPDRFARADGCMLTGCYLVSRSLLIQLLDTYSETRPEIADMCLYHVQRTLADGEGWVFHPMLACQILDSSDIQTPDHQATIVRWTRDHMSRWGDRYTLI